MTEVKRDCRILLIVDKVDEAKDLTHILRNDFAKYITTAFSHEAANYYRMIKPDLLMVSCDEIASSQHVIEQINAAIAPQTIPYTLLLTQSCETEEALSLLKKQIVNSFVSDRPLYEPYSVIASVSYGLNDVLKYRALNTELTRLNRCIDDMFELGDKRLQEIMSSSISYTADLSSELDQLHNDIQVASKPDGQLDSGFVNSRLKSLNEEKVMFRGKELEAKLHQQRKFYQATKQEYEAHLSELSIQCEEQEKVNALLIDDDEFYREAMITMVEETNINVFGVEGSHEGLRCLHDFTPDVILLDYEMPELNGIQVLERLKEDEQTSAIPVIMLTGFNSRDIVKDSITSGASDFIVKPGSLDVLTEKISRCTGKEVTDGS